MALILVRSYEIHFEIHYCLVKYFGIFAEIFDGSFFYEYKYSFNWLNPYERPFKKCFRDLQASYTT